MKKIIEKVVAVTERVAFLYHTEPVAVRMGLAAILNTVVVSGAISVGVAANVQTVALAALNVVFLVATRQKVTPTVIADLNQLDAYLKGHKHAQDIIDAAQQLLTATEKVTSAVQEQNTTK